MTAILLLINNPAVTGKRIMGMVLISPSHQADFEIHIMSQLGLESRDTDYPVLPGGHHLGGKYNEIVTTIFSRFALKGDRIE
jgi:type IV secretory pathway VirJ component